MSSRVAFKHVEKSAHMLTDPFGLRTATVEEAQGEYAIDWRTPNCSRGMSSSLTASIADNGTVHLCRNIGLALGLSFKAACNLLHLPKESWNTVR